MSQSHSTKYSTIHEKGCVNTTKRGSAKKNQKNGNYLVAWFCCTLQGLLQGKKYAWLNNLEGKCALKIGFARKLAANVRGHKLDYKVGEIYSLSALLSGEDERKTL